MMCELTGDGVVLVMATVFFLFFLGYFFGLELGKRSERKKGGDKK